MSISITEALKTESYAYKCWYNYNYGKNTLGISDSEYSSIISKWSKSIGTWSDFAKDENKYEISDSELDNYRAKGKESAKDKTGYAGGGKGKMIARGTADAVGAVAGAASIKVGGKVLGKALVGKVGSAGAGKTAEGAASSAAGFVVAAPLSLAIATAYFAKKANKEQKEACDELKNEVLPEAQASLTETQEYMEETEEELLALSEEAEDKNEETNDKIEDKKSDFDAERRIYDYLKTKKESGEPLREDEIEWLNEHAPLMAQISEEINTLSEETSEKVNDLHDQMGEKQENYDEAACNIAEADGTMQYAASFDSTTKTMCIVEGIAQGINAGSGYIAGTKAAAFAASGTALFGATAWAWAFAAMGYAGGAMSTKAAAEQIDWSKQIDQEISLRKNVEEFSADTTDILDEKVEVYEGAMGTVEDLELEIPDDLEVPEGVTTEGSTESEEGEEGAQVDTGLLQEPETDENKKEKEEVK